MPGCDSCLQNPALITPAIRSSGLNLPGGQLGARREACPARRAYRAGLKFLDYFTRVFIMTINPLSARYKYICIWSHYVQDLDDIGNPRTHYCLTLEYMFE